MRYYHPSNPEVFIDSVIVEVAIKAGLLSEEKVIYMLTSFAHAGGTGGRFRVWLQGEEGEALFYDFAAMIGPHWWGFRITTTLRELPPNGPQNS